MELNVSLTNVMINIDILQLYHVQIKLVFSRKYPKYKLNSCNQLLFKQFHVLWNQLSTNL